ncbi:MAG: hypothetical protein JWN01_348 [Patescibacteria group bacterium]|nr:hypothetical protein [Patescibacteria group bacterium]
MKTKTRKLITSRQLFLDAWSRFRPHWKSYARLLIIVSLPANLLLLGAGTGPDSFVGSFVTFAIVIMNVALIWSVIQARKTGQVPGPAKAYYEGTTALVRYLLIALALVAMFLPAAIGAALYTVGANISRQSGLNGGEQLLIGLACAIIASPSFYLLVRYGLAFIVVIHDDLRPMAALRRSRAITLGRFWPLVGRVIMLVVFLAVISLPATLITFILALLKLSAVSTVFFQVATTLVALPLANLYLVHLYEELSAKETTA